jgi:lysophospholipase L1-like esterase
VSILTLGVTSALQASGGTPVPLAFNFGSGSLPAGSRRVFATNHFTTDAGFGFEPGTSVVAEKDYVSSTNPILFSVRLPEGNYRVTVSLSGKGETVTTVKAEARRLMVENVRTSAGKSETRSFVANVRTPKIPGGTEVRLKPRERESEWVSWDDKLTLEFNGQNVCLRALEIEPADVPTVFLLGDSTVCDQPREPWNSWGQMLPRFFKPEIAIANHAESGESMKSSLGARRFEKVLCLMKSNDWLFVQFGHNDMKDRAPDALAAYKANLKKIVVQARAKGDAPVLVTSMERMSGVTNDTLGKYPATVREVANEERVPLIDLNAMSKVLYRALGTNLASAFQDGTHHNNYGSYELARCVVEGIRQNVPALAKFLSEDAGAFDPAHPDAPQTFRIAVSSQSSHLKPDGD